MWTEIQRALDESTTQVMTGLARLLPGVAAMIVAVLIAVLIGWLVGSIVRRALRGVDFDRARDELGLAGHLRLVGLEEPVDVREPPGQLDDHRPRRPDRRSPHSTATLTSRLVMRVFDLLPNLVMAGLLFLVGSVLARFLSRGVLIGAVNMNLQYARLLRSASAGWSSSWPRAMALDHVGIGGNIVSLAFAILFGGIVLALALAVGLGSKELVARSLERESLKAPEDAEPPSTFRHL